MTIAAGILCADGIVMCADSQEIVGDFKWPVKKLRFPRITTGDTRLVVTGAGFGPAIDAVTDTMFSRISMAMLTREQTLETIRDILRDIYKNDLPIHPAGQLSDLDFRLLVAFHASDGWGLFITSGPLIVPVEDFEVIGSGEVTKFFAHLMYRKNLLDRPSLSMYEGTVLAAYLIHLAKSQMSSIGGKSQIVALGADGNMLFANEWEIPHWENFFTSYQGWSHELMLDCANPLVDRQHFAANLNKYASRVRAAKKSLAAKRAEWDRLWEQVREAGGMLAGHTPTPSVSQKSKGRQ